MTYFIEIFIPLLLIQAGLVLSWDTPRITTPGQFPYLVGIMWKPNALAIHFTSCSASILSEYWYLTSAYCVAHSPDMGEIVVKAGSHDIAARDQEFDQIIAIDTVIVHEKYPGRGIDQANLAYYDIGLIKGRTALVFNDYVQPIKIAKQKSVLHNERLDYNLVSSGWGLFPHQLVPDRPTTMRTIQLPVVPNRICQDAIRNIFPQIRLSDMQMCTRPLDGTLGACINNYGGPLVQYKDNQPIAIGIVTWSTGPCNTNNLPPIYIRVSRFAKWIKRKMKQNP